MTPEQKSEFFDQAKAHFAADMLMLGTYADECAGWFKGCSVGCHLQHIMPTATAAEITRLARKHRCVADYYGYPEWLAQLQDLIFEGLPNGESAAWHVLLAETLAETPAAYDWQAALHRVHAAILRISYKTAGTAQTAVNLVLDLHERAGHGEKITDNLWSTAENAARSAARNAVWSAESAATSAATSAIWSQTRNVAENTAENAAMSAARNAAMSAVWNAAMSAVWNAAASAAMSAIRSVTRSAESAIRSAAERAAYRELRDGVLTALADGCVSKPDKHDTNKR